MILRFGDFELDTGKVELRRSGHRVDVEPQVFALLALLATNHDRLVSRDEIIDRIWDGRFISDAAVASRVKSARHALGDSGEAQAFIRTVHGRGFRFVADVTTMHSAARSEASSPASTRPSIAVLPFHATADPSSISSAIAHALPDELIAELSRMHWLFVIARGSSFRLRNAAAATVGSTLGVRYCLSGSVETTGRNIVVSVELADTRDGGVVWADRIAGVLDNIHAIRSDICARVVTALELRIPLHEAGQAHLTVSENLDAWSAYHLGLQHMYRFNRTDNAAARVLFEQAVFRDPGFARAHSGLSFVHFQTAFLRHTTEIDTEIAKARACAERALELDPLDPFVNFTMGRSFWLSGDLGISLGWLERATTLSPSYAHGIYARAWTESLSGNAASGREHADLAMRLSPIDPLFYAMLGTRAFTHMAAGEDKDAAAWAERAAQYPGAHVMIAMIAVVANALAGDAARAGHWAGNVRARNPALTRADFFRSFPMQVEPMRARVAAALAAHGFGGGMA